MSREKFSEFISNTYSKEIIDQISEKYAPYKSSTFKKKDEILRRIHIISLLSNTITKDSKKMIENLMKRKIEVSSNEEGSSSISSKRARIEEVENIATKNINEILLEEEEPYYNPVSPDYAPNSDMEEEEEYYNDGADDNYEIHEEVLILDKNKMSADEESYRFYCPMIMSASNFNVLSLLTVLGMKVPDGFPIEEVDIIDSECKKFIYVIDSTYQGMITEKRKKLAPIKTGFVVCNWSKGIIETNEAQGLNTLSARDFIVKRAANIITYFPSLGLDNTIEEEIISEFVTMEKDKWVNEIRVALNEIPIRASKSKTELPNSFPSITLKDILENMENIIEDRKEMEEAVWNGKLLPFSSNDPIIIEKETNDKEMIREHFPQFGKFLHIKCKKKEADEYINVIHTIHSMCFHGEINNFSTLTTKRTMKKTLLSNKMKMEKSQLDTENVTGFLRSLGVGMKGKKRSNEIENPKQKTYKEIEERAYPSWMEDVFIKECKKSGLVTLSHLHFDEWEPTHPIDIATTKTCEYIKEIYSKTNSACTTAKYMNIGSRIGGSYLIAISKENKAHSSVATIPIYFAAHDEMEEKKKRVLCGFLIRGPHHVREGTDRINVIILEKIKNMNKKMIKIGAIFLDKTGNEWFISKNSFNRASPLHNAFLHDLLFLPSNYIGDIIFQSSQGIEDLQKKSIEVPRENEDFLLHRMTELSLMGILGGSQEEGFFSGYRMLYMVLLELSRGNDAGLVDLEGFMEGINECAISNCLVLFLYASLFNSLIYIMEVKDDQRSGFTLM